MRSAIFDLVFEDDSILADVDPEPTSQNSVEYIADESTPWGGTGITAGWTDEGVKIDRSKLATKKRVLKIHKLAALVEASEELLEDAPRLNARLSTGASEAIRWKASEALMNGDGVGKPLGWTLSGALVTVAKEGSQTADTVVAANVAKMYARLLRPGNGIWYINADVFPQLPLMTLGDQPIFVPPSSGFRDAPGGFLLGRPVRINEHCATVGDLHDIQFVDPGGYYAVMKRGGIRFAQSAHLFFDYDTSAFRWTFRLGGQPFLESTVSPAKGSNAKSHFVSLAERT
jgi:HK97 family phage major capsid protein